uniref:Uncharacterized protein n=1 Tax=Amphora coffeiformis TaxID=265554 RepID=A0A7S3L5Z9_9STRA|mmetsp:Transcript_17452/g.35108  ORF Transcript_17452/g.35108 Transcript_17452/m.35108 type:complete len:261 (+) Transcript_17452:1320-2102(+)|eukprot:scaffold6420_cov168-Amphora_coffeaeformis.AAC.12
MTHFFRLTLLLSSFLSSCKAFSAPASSSSTSGTSTNEPHWLDVLKFDGQKPGFDVIAKTIEYTSQPGYIRFALKDIPTEYYDKDYIFRGPIVGPINREDLVRTNSLFGLDKSFPDLKRQPFGFAVDPENPFRVVFFERWVGTHTGELDLLGILKAPPTGNKSVSPLFPFSITWTPEGKIIYEALTTAVDRFEGNARGKVAVFGLLETACISLENSVGNPILRFQQKLNCFLNSSAQIYSRDDDIPSWWKSKARGADPNDM